MSARQDPDGEADFNETRAEQPPPTPDEAGPHDIPDDEVIEATLPAKSVSTDMDTSSGSGR
jgi:hypothetical protein